jgi:hypothetical protein
MAPEEGTTMLICRNCLEILEYIELPKNPDPLLATGCCEFFALGN